MEKQEAIALVNRLIKKRFGLIGDTLKPQLNTLSIEKLELLGENLFDFNTFDEVINWLNNVT